MTPHFFQTDLAYTWYRLNVVSRWLDSPLKTTVLASINARIVYLTTNQPQETN